MKCKGLLLPAVSIVLSAAVLFLVSISTRDLAQQNKDAALKEIMSYMFPGSAYAEEPYSGEDESITYVYKADTGYMVEATVMGYVGDITLWVAVQNDGSVTGVMVKDMAETYGLGRHAQLGYDFLMQFIGTAGNAGLDSNVDAITGATVTSKAVTRAVNAASGFVTGADVSSGATEWSG